MELAVSNPNGAGRPLTPKVQRDTKAKKKLAYVMYLDQSQTNLQRIAKRVGVNVDTIRYWAAAGNWQLLRQRRRELLESIERAGNPRDVFEMIGKYVKETAADLVAGRITRDEAKAQALCAESLVRAAEGAYNNLGFKWKQSSNNVLSVLKDHDLD